MPILTRAECAKYAEAVVVAVFADRISAYAVQKNAAGISLLAVATENREEGEMNEENIRFSCQKVLQAMPREHLFTQRPVIFLLDPSHSDCSFISVDALRERKDTPVSDAELAAITAKFYHSGKETESIFRNFPIEYLVDGFAVPQPAGLNGQNITARLVSVSAPRALESAFMEAASSHGLAYAGMITVCQAISESPFPAGKEDGIDIALFRDKTVLVLRRSGRCAGIGMVPLGYGILEHEAAKAFSIGAQETRDMMRAWQEKKTDESVTNALGTIAKQGASGLAEQLKHALAALDPDHLLPGAITIMQFGPLAQPAEALSQNADWFKDAPIARNAHAALMTGFDEKITDAHNVLTDHPESAADTFLIISLFT